MIDHIPDLYLSKWHQETKLGTPSSNIEGTFGVAVEKIIQIP